MYILKNAIKNIGRNKGRNILLLVLSLIIISMSAVSMLLKNYVSQSANYYGSNYGSKVTILSSFKEPLDKEVLLSFGDSSLLTKSEQRGMIAVILNELKVVESQGSDDLIKWIGSSKSEIEEAFESGEKKIVEGNKFTKENEVLISKRLADLNKLKVGNQITIANQGEEVKLRISGIYNNVSLQANDNFGKTTYTNPWNEIYTNWKTMESSSLFDANANCSIELYLKKPDDISKLREELLAKGMPESYILSQDLDTYKQKMEPIYQLERVANNLMYGVMAIGGLLIVLVSTMAIKERKYEVGILRSIGMNKAKIARGFLYESFVIIAVALVISLSTTAFVAKPMINTIIQEESLKEHLDVSLSKDNIVQCGLLSSSLALVSSISGIFMIMRYEPRRILSS